MNESRRRLALRHELLATSRRARRAVALFVPRRWRRSPSCDGPLCSLGTRAVRVASARAPWAEVNREESKEPLEVHMHSKGRK